MCNRPWASYCDIGCMTQRGTSNVCNKGGYTATYAYSDAQPCRTHRFEYMLALAVPRYRSRYRSGIVPTTIQILPIQRPFIEVTFHMAVLFYHGALWEGSAKQAFCQRFKLASRGYHREVASSKRSRVDSWQRYCFIAVPCGDSTKHAPFHSSILVSRRYPQEVESFSYHCRMFSALCALGISVLGYLLDMLGYLLCPGVGRSTR